MRIRDQRRQPSPSDTSRSLLEPDWTPDENLPIYEQNLIRLLLVGQRFCGQTQGIVERLSQEVAQITQGQARLSLYCQERTERASQQSLPAGSTSFPVQFFDHVYGTLCVQNDPVQSTQPVVPAAVAYLLTQVCAYILYALEVTALLQIQYQHLESQAYESLTIRQREVLDLLCLGYDPKAIAQTLHITKATVDSHRQHIYEKLQVHSRQELLLVAFRTGLFSPLEAVSGVRPHV